MTSNGILSKCCNAGLFSPHTYVGNVCQKRSTVFYKSNMCAPKLLDCFSAQRAGATIKEEKSGSAVKIKTKSSAGNWVRLLMSRIVKFIFLHKCALEIKAHLIIAAHSLQICCTLRTLILMIVARRVRSFINWRVSQCDWKAKRRWRWSIKQSKLIRLWLYAASKSNCFYSW